MKNRSSYFVIRTIKSVSLAAVLTLIPSASAQFQLELGIETYAGLTITGEVGKVYTVEYVTQLKQEEQWKSLEFVELLESPFLWTDRSAPVKEKRFYRAVQIDAPTNMVWIPPGTFLMGSPANETDRLANEGPQTCCRTPQADSGLLDGRVSKSPCDLPADGVEISQSTEG